MVIMIITIVTIVVVIVIMYFALASQGHGNQFASRVSISRGGIIMCIGNSQEVLSQRILVGVILVWRLGVLDDV